MPATVAEIERVARKGCHSITFSDNPATKGMPSLHDEHWEPLWKACSNNQIVINVHIGSGARAPHSSMQTPIDAWITTMPMSISYSAADWLHLAALQKYDLRVSLSEGGIGWIPYLLERADFTHLHHSSWTHAGLNFGTAKPSEVFHRHFLTCFIEDKFGLMNLHFMNEDHVAYECDYPHSDCQWPTVPEHLYENVKHLTDEQIDKITYRNALRFFNYDAIGMMGGRENCTVGSLRAQAAHVSTAEESRGGASPLAPDEEPRRVTSGDIIHMYSSADGNEE